jgi:hypothetical protein
MAPLSDMLFGTIMIFDVLVCQKSEELSDRHIHQNYGTVVRYVVWMSIFDVLIHQIYNAHSEKHTFDIFFLYVDI